MRNTHIIFVEKTVGKRSLEDPDVGERIILKWIFSKHGANVWSEFIWLRIGTSGWLF
jgi:hypothetical protein